MPVYYARFNGAAASQLRKCTPRRSQDTHCPHRHASMGPQHLSCGNYVQCAEHHGDQRASMGPQHLSCGNVLFVGRANAESWLQWGRSISAAEIAKGIGGGRGLSDASMGPQHLSCGNHEAKFDELTKYAASMGPQHLSCGNHHSRHHLQPRLRCFNGAAASQLRK